MAQTVPPATAEKVRAFQKAKGLAADGVMGPQTWARLKAAGITCTSSGKCTDRNRKNCTSLQDIRVGTIDGVIALKKNSGCKVVITGGTEVGHAGGTYSHWNGYKVDVSRTSCVTTYIHKHSKKHHKRGDGAWVWRVTSGGKTVIDYADENWANHWDITYY